MFRNYLPIFKVEQNKYLKIYKLIKMLNPTMKPVELASVIRFLLKRKGSQYFITLLCSRARAKNY